MALITCLECGKEVSDKANACPACGAPIANKQNNTKFCKHCGEIIDSECVICPKCGKQVEEIKTAPCNTVVVNNNAVLGASVGDVRGMREKNKWIAFLLCLFLGYIGAHKFYEGKVLMGILYIFTIGLFGIGWFIDLIVLLLKPNPYY